MGKKSPCRVRVKHLFRRENWRRAIFWASSAYYARTPICPQMRRCSWGRQLFRSIQIKNSTVLLQSLSTVITRQTLEMRPFYPTEIYLQINLLYIANIQISAFYKLKHHHFE